MARPFTEADLHAPIAELLTAQGYTVRGEVGELDDKVDREGHDQTDDQQYPQIVHRAPPGGVNGRGVAR
jgi:hypothetical protein